MENVLLVIHLLLAIALIFVVLMQRTAQDGGGLVGGGGGGGTMGGLFTARGSANLLTRITSILATAFIGTSLILGIMAGHSNKPRSLVDEITPVEAPAGETKNETATEKAPEAPATPAPAPAAPEVPVSK